MSLHWCNIRVGGNSCGWPILDSPLSVARWSVTHWWPHIAQWGAKVTVHGWEYIRALITACLIGGFAPWSRRQSNQLKSCRVFLEGLWCLDQVRSCSLPPFFQRCLGRLRLSRWAASMALYGSICCVTARAWDFCSTLLSPVTVALENWISLCSSPCVTCSTWSKYPCMAISKAPTLLASFLQGSQNT